jgi:hypothetical protein
VTYIITNQGIGIRFAPRQVDHRLFFKFNEIRQAGRIKVPGHIPLRWEVLTPQRYPKGGILLYLAKPEDSSKQIQGELLLNPTDIDRFLRELAGHGIVMQADSASSD